MEQTAAHAHHPPAPLVDLAPQAAPAPQEPSDAAPPTPAQQRPPETEALYDILEEVYRTPIPNEGGLSLGIMDMLQQLTRGGNVSFEPNPSGTVTTSHAAGRTTIQQAQMTVEKDGEQSKENVWVIIKNMISPRLLRLLAVLSVRLECLFNGIVYVPCYQTPLHAPRTDNTTLHTDTLCTGLLRVDKEEAVKVTSLLSEAAWRSTAPDTTHLHHVVVDCKSTQLVKQPPQATQGVIPAQASSPWSTGGSSPASGPVLGNVPPSAVDASRPTHTVKQFVVRVVLCDTSGGPSGGNDTSGGPSGENIHVEWTFHGCHDPTLSPESVRQQVLAKVTEKLNKSQMSNERIFLGGVNNRAIVLAGDELANLKRLIEIRVLYWLIYTGDVTQETPAVPFDMTLGCAGHKIKVGLQHPAVTNKQGVLKNKDLSEETLKQVGEDYLLGTGRERTHASAEAPGPSTDSAPRKARASTAGKRTSKGVDASDDELDYDSDGIPRRRKKDNDDPDAGPQRKRSTKHKAADPAAPPTPPPLTRSQVTQLPISPELVAVMLLNKTVIFYGVLEKKEDDAAKFIRAFMRDISSKPSGGLFRAKMWGLQAPEIALTLRYIAAIALVIANIEEPTFPGMEEEDMKSVKKWIEYFSTRLTNPLSGGELEATQMSLGAPTSDAGMPRVSPPEFNIAWILVTVLFATQETQVKETFIANTLVQSLTNVMQTSDPVLEARVLISSLQPKDPGFTDKVLLKMKVPKPLSAY